MGTRSVGGVLSIDWEMVVYKRSDGWIFLPHDTGGEELNSMKVEVITSSGGNVEPLHNWLYESFVGDNERPISDLLAYLRNSATKYIPEEKDGQTSGTEMLAYRFTTGPKLLIPSPSENEQAWQAGFVWVRLDENGKEENNVPVVNDCEGDKKDEYFKSFIINLARQAAECEDTEDQDKQKMWEEI